MKKKTMSVSDLLVATIILGSLGSFITVQAEETPVEDEKIEAKSTGKVNFLMDDTEIPVVVDPTNPDNSGEIVPGEEGGTGNGTKGLNISWVSNFKFPEIKISSKKMQTFAEPTTLNFVEETQESKPNIANFLQVIDNRGTFSGWKVMATATPFISQDNSELKGAELLLNNPQVIGSFEYDEALTPDSHPSKVDLLKNTAQPVKIFTAAVNQGQGVWNLVWSPKADGAQKGFEYDDKNGVELIVPGSATPKVGVTYTSNITWILSDTPNE